MRFLKEFMHAGKYDIQYNEGTGESFGVLMYEYPAIEQAKKNYRTDTVPGRDGELVEEEDYKSNITINCTFSVIHENFMVEIRKLKRWLTGTGRLSFSDTPDTFYRVLKVEHNNLERELRKFGRFEVRFICYPYEFLHSGQQAIDSVEYNPYDRCKPLYEIVGEGSCSLTVNGKTMVADVGQNLTIDTELMMAFREDGTLMNTSVSGDYMDLWLPHGKNSINISEGFQIKITPRWGYEA